MSATDGEQSHPARRDVLRGIGAATGLVGLTAATGGVGLGLLRWSTASETSGDAGGDAVGEATGVDAADAPTTVNPFGQHQAGIDRPATPQRHGAVTVWDVPWQRAAEVTAGLSRLGAAIAEVATGSVQQLPDGPRDITLTVGIGPRLARLLYGADAPGTEELPAFDRDAPGALTGGDLFLAAYSSDANDVEGAISAATASEPTASDLTASDLTLRWVQRGFRALGEGTIARNPLAFHDGVIVPRGQEQMDENVWIGSGPAQGGTIMVIRRIALDSAKFRAEPIPEQEKVIGRHRKDGAPLSGGGPTGEVDLLAKTPTGEFITPVRSHVRAAHPSFTGSSLMLRRGYAFDNGEGDSGLMFICFQRELRTFVQTQQRMEENDDLLEYMTVTASGTFLILPGFTESAPLGQQ